ncbi:hypothetical protein Pmar_PMAR009166 [Perkinsus marinus ATCC 50983]|uniref:Uncharacterized protein n=1 Tax=Perkinsus marinus (strain ATCC 50983 / TXsc) TaxID=423536 RepID=C5KBL8_PERM5|nr:hypothetical protein Pmar_PMAR009166 [Perkinsus marinus ATCC 50983]EER18138.1 hypothetical protein Pmar_PMAR009166 [Perkinsus marinus ATCC 50983]|eukprot:XP_002786342.1 hypothetical protein Pmar_PMAR009166 [Perkinsus marinus ATCC 50983]
MSMLIGLGRWCAETFVNDEQLEFDQAASSVSRGTRRAVKTEVEKTSPKPLDQPAVLYSPLIVTAGISLIVVAVSSVAYSMLASRYSLEVLEMLAIVDQLVEIRVFTCGYPLFRLGLFCTVSTLLLLIFRRMGIRVFTNERTEEPIYERKTVPPLIERVYEHLDAPKGSALVERVLEVLALPEGTEANPNGFEFVHIQNQPHYVLVEKRSLTVGSAKAGEKALSQWRITVHFRGQRWNRVREVMSMRSEEEWNSQCTGWEVLPVLAT